MGTTDDSAQNLQNKAFELLGASERAIGAVEVAALFVRSGIRRPADDLPRIQKMLDHANVLIGAWVGDRLIGIARGFSDFSYCCYLSDLAVDRDFQRSGIGRALVHYIRQRLGDHVMIVLLSSPEAEDYYPHLGFERASNAWKLPRR
jgi:GNAT superfamily N-acetyltransferase